MARGHIVDFEDDSAAVGAPLDSPGPHLAPTAPTWLSRSSTSAVNGHTWGFYASLSDVELDLTVTYTASPNRAARTYHKPPHHLASAADTAAF